MVGDDTTLHCMMLELNDGSDSGCGRMQEALHMLGEDVVDPCVSGSSGVSDDGCSWMRRY